MANSPTATSMLAVINAEVPRLFSAATFQHQPMDDAAIYEAYVYTCVIEALEVVKRLCPTAGVRWKLVGPSGNPNLLVLRKKACPIGTAAGRYSYVRIWVGKEEYELHTDVPVEGQSRVPSELDIVLLRADACDTIRMGQMQTPRSSDVVLFIEAKCYSHALKLGIGREFLGLHKAEFGGEPTGYLVSTANNEHIEKMVGYHGKRKRPFWSNMNDLAASRQPFVNDLARQLSRALVAKPKPRKLAQRQQALSSTQQMQLPGT